MMTFTRIGIVAMMAGAAWTTGARADGLIFATLDGRDLKIAELTTPYAAIHFGVEHGPGGVTGHLNEVALSAPMLAGVTHLFVLGANSGAQDAIGAREQALAVVKVVRDPGGASAKVLGVSEGPHVVVIVDRDGKELSRLESTDFGAFAGAFRGVSKVSALGEYNVHKGDALAVEGYDVVSYFTQTKAVKGDKALTSEYRGVSYRFSTAENRDLFAADPDRYLPTYGGWCASAMGAKGTKVEIDPTNFKVKDGRLFLFYKSIWGDALKDWNQHEAEWEPAADRNWKKIADEDPIKPRLD